MGGNSRSKVSRVLNGVNVCRSVCFWMQSVTVLHSAYSVFELSQTYHRISLSATSPNLSVLRP